jgi:hypothetical protein
MRRLAAIVLMGLVLAPLASAAANGPVFGLRALGNPKRGYFIYTLTPGGTRTGGVIVSNTGTAAGTVKLFTADATTGRTTGTVYLTDTKPKNAGAWITLASPSLSLRPGQHKTVRFTVHVPSNAPAGQWVGGVVAETTHQLTGPKSKQKANVQIRIRDLTIVAVQVDVPGPPVVGVAVGSVKTGGQRGFQQVITHLENTGNRLIKPTGQIAILDSHGTRVQTLPFTMDTFLPHTTIDYPVLLKKALPAGGYQAVVRITIPAVAGASAKTVTAHPAFTVSKQDVQQVFTSATPQAPPPVASTPTSSSTLWAPIAAAAGAIVLLLLLLWLLRRRRKAKRRPVTTLQRSASAAAADAGEEAAPLAQRTEPPPSQWSFPEPAEPQPEPEPEPATPEAEPIPAPPVSPPTSDHEHLWDVAYDRGELGSDGVWRFPHRCRTCGKELLARDVADASAHADA